MPTVRLDLAMTSLDLDDSRLIGSGSLPGSSMALLNGCRIAWTRFPSHSLLFEQLPRAPVPLTDAQNRSPHTGLRSTQCREGVVRHLATMQYRHTRSVDLVNITNRLDHALNQASVLHRSDTW